MPTSRPARTSGKLGEILEYYSDIEELKDEMEEWRDNMPESLQSSDKYSAVDEAANTLSDASSELEESCDEIKRILGIVPEDESGRKILDVLITYTERKMYKGYQMPRWVRLANPVAALGAAMGFIEEHHDVLMGCLTEDDFQNLDHYVRQVGEALEGLEAVDFPSMFG